MDNKGHNEIIKQEVDKLLNEIKEAYETSGKRTSGEFASGLEVIYESNKAIIKGHTYLAGRKAGMMPPIENIKRWIETKGIRPIADKMTTTGLAWAIAKKIAREGTNEVNHLKIYEQIITPHRIDEIIKRVSDFNVNLFINELTTRLELLVKNI